MIRIAGSVDQPEAAEPVTVRSIDDLNLVVILKLDPRILRFLNDARSEAPSSKNFVRVYKAFVERLHMLVGLHSHKTQPCGWLTNHIAFEIVHAEMLRRLEGN